MMMQNNQRQRLRTEDKYKFLHHHNLLSRPTKEQDGWAALAATYLRLSQQFGGEYNTKKYCQVPVTATTQEFNRLAGTQFTWQQVTEFFKLYLRMGVIKKHKASRNGHATVYELCCPILLAVAAQGPSYWISDRPKPKRHLKLVG